MFATESQTQTEDQPPTLAEIVREVTDNGRTIINFLQDAMDGRLDGFEPCHRIAAARELAKRGDKRAIAFLQSFYPKSNGRKSNGRKPSPAIGEALPDDELAPNDELAEIVREVTDNGRTIVCFLHDAMQGILDGFKPCHRVASAKELLRRGFDSSPGHTTDDDYEYEDHDESFDDDPGSPNYVDPNANRYNNEDDPFDFENYDEEQFIRDRDGERALRHIYGSEEAVTIAHEAVARHRQQTIFDESHIPDRDFTPIEKPEDDLYGKGHYGYNALRFVFDDNQSVGVANRIVEEFKKRMAEYDGPKDRPSCCYPRWSRHYALAAVRKSFEYPDDVEPQPDQTAENTDTGESQMVQSPEDPDPGNSESREPNRAKDPPLSVILERSNVRPERSNVRPERSHVILSEVEGPPAPTPPPRQPTPNTYPGSPADGPPADGPRERRDPGDIRIPLRNLLSVSVGPL